MGGYSTGHLNPTELAIASEEVGYWRIQWVRFQWAIGEERLLALAKRVLVVFDSIERRLIQQTNTLRRDGGSLREGLTLPEEECRKYFAELARYGKLAYQGLFPAESQHLISRIIVDRIQPAVPAPTFVSELTPFPWEVLYQGEDHKNPDSNSFWGFGYAPARILDMRHSTYYASGHDSIRRMLFCLHHELRQAHKEEWPTIKRMVAAANGDEVSLLGDLPHVTDGESLLDHLYGADHNMLHFACHARQEEAGNDVLTVSLIQVDDLLGASGDMNAAEVIELDTDTFVLTDGKFASQPFVFLNACHSGGGADELRDSYNLPKKFIEAGAAAVLATACPVPDVFAAEFARVFYGYFLWGRVIDAEVPSRNAARPMPVGEALRRTRRYFLEVHNNPLGLAYGLYSPGHYQMHSLHEGERDE